MSLSVMATSMQALDEANCMAMLGRDGIFIRGSNPPVWGKAFSGVNNEKLYTEICFMNNLLVDHKK